MGRARERGNEKLGEYVQRRTGGTLELRFPLPEDVRHAFLDGGDRPRKQLIRSLGTSDVKLANALADSLRTSIRDQIHRVREMRSSDALGDYLQSLHDSEIADFRRRQQGDEAARRRAYFRVRGASAEMAPGAAFFANSRHSHAGALLSDNPAEVLAAAGWAANDFYRRRGEEPDVASPEYRIVLEQCAVVLTDAIIGQDALEDGRSEPTPLSEFLRSPTKPGSPGTALTDRGRLPISKYFETVYAPVQVGEAGPVKRRAIGTPYRRPIGTPPFHGSAARRVALNKRRASPLGELRTVEPHPEGVWGRLNNLWITWAGA